VSGARAVRRELESSGVMVVTLDVPDEPLNILSRAMTEEFSALLTELELPGPDLRAVVIRSGKPDSFIAGADIKDFQKVKSAEEGETLSRTGQALLDRLEAIEVPVVAAIHGVCLGGGLETVLACRYRVASDHPKTSLGLPEVMLGLLPGAGGSQRLPRLVGLARSLDVILTGRGLRAPQALKAGVVDEVVPAAALLDAARKAALALADGSLKPRRRGIRIGERLARQVIFRKARASVLKKTGGHYPAPLAALDVVAKGISTSQAKGLELEARQFGLLSVSDVSRALVSIFFATQEIKKDAGYPEGTESRRVRKLGVLGAGLMGAGISAKAAEVGISVRMKDTSSEALGRGLRHARDVFEGRRRRGRLSRLELARTMDRISASLDYSGFRRAELVIEAVFEDLDLKRKVLAETEAAVADETVIASNTSSIPIADIARDAKRPEHVLGMHFFSPVHKMPLLEVIVTEHTTATATATAVELGKRLGKHVIVVTDGPGFYTTRALSPYMNEAARLLEEGATVEAVDKALTEFGFPVGPITLLDEVGIDVGAKVAKILHGRFGDRMAPPASMSAVVEDGRLGRKNKRGFYTYEGKKRVDKSVYALLPAGTQRRSFESREIQDRLVFSFLNEAVLCLEDGILRSPRDGDSGASSASASRRSWVGRSATWTTWGPASPWRYWSG